MLCLSFNIAKYPNFLNQPVQSTPMSTGSLCTNSSMTWSTLSSPSLLANSNRINYWSKTSTWLSFPLNHFFNSNTNMKNQCARHGWINSVASRDLFNKMNNLTSLEVKQITLTYPGWKTQFQKALAVELSTKRQWDYKNRWEGQFSPPATWLPSSSASLILRCLCLPSRNY